MKICKKKYRIVRDEFAGFEVQKKVWYYPFWFEIYSKWNDSSNTNNTIEKAEELIEIDKTNSREPIKKPDFVVKTYDCE